MASIQQSLELADSAGSMARRSLSRAHPGASLGHGSTLRALRRWLPGVALIGLFLGSWELAPRLGWVEPAFLPPFSEVVRSGIELARNGQLWAHVTESLTRAGGYADIDAGEADAG